jgi:hypothetical protein
LEKSVGRNFPKLLNNGNSAKESVSNDENLDEDIVEEDYCEPVSMQETQDRCMVSSVSWVIEFLLGGSKLVRFLASILQGNVIRHNSYVLKICQNWTFKLSESFYN